MQHTFGIYVNGQRRGSTGKLSSANELAVSLCYLKKYQSVLVVHDQSKKVYIIHWLDVPIPLWKSTWRKGFAPLLLREELQVMSEALARDDPNIIQEATTHPPPLMCVQDWPVEKCDLLAYSFVGMHGGFQASCTVGETEEYFARFLFEADQRIGQPAGSRHWLNWYDNTPREEMRTEMLAEIRIEIHGRIAELCGFYRDIPEGVLVDWIEENGIIV